MTVAGLQVLAVPVGAFAHGLTARADLPIPAWLFAWAATLVLLVSFAALAVLWRKPLLASCKERELIPFGVGVDLLLGTVGIACFVLVCWAGLVGTFVPTANLAPTAIWVLFWVGVPVASACFGDIFRLLSPWRSTARLVGWLIGQLVPEGLPAPRRWPERLGRLPAVAGLLAMGWLELAYSGRDDPHTLAVLALLYAAVQLVGMSFWGVETWSDRGDSFGVLFSLISKIAPLGRVDGRLQLRVPLSGLARLTEIRWTQLLLLVVIGTTTFDGFTQGPLWADFSVWLRDRFSDGGLAMTAAGEAASTIGLFAAILVVSGIWLAGVRGAATRLGS
ncbi:MAG: fenitrothion hydrolase, partial [Actinomycetes bacterium]